MADALASVALERLLSAPLVEASLVVDVEEEFERLIKNLQIIKSILLDADQRQVINVWAESLRAIIHVMDNLVDEWCTAICKSKTVGVENSPMLHSRRKVSSRSLKPLALPPGLIAIKEIHRQVNLLFQKMPRSLRRVESERVPTTSAINISEVRGRDMDQDKILKELLVESTFRGNSDLFIISIVGMVGIGKTTLAQLAYNHPEVEAYFDERIWVCMSPPSDPIRIFTTIVEALEKKPCNHDDLDILQIRIKKFIGGKKFLIVLDDVWACDVEMLEQLKACLLPGEDGSRILVSTRNQNVAKMMGTVFMYTLRELSQGDCWALFSQIAFSEKSREEAEELEEIGMKIADRCKGLPLAAKTLAYLMRFEDNIEDWENVLRSEVWRGLIEQHLFPALWWSYSSLPPALKLCLSYCAIFPKGYTFEIGTLTKLWMAQWHLISPWQTMEMETTAQNYFEELAMLSFFQDFEKDHDGCIISCKMHDVMYEFVQFLEENECCVIEVNTEKETIIGPSFGEVYHASLSCPPNTILFDPSWIGKSLCWRTLLVMSKDNLGIASALPTMLQCLPCIRALDLSNNCFIEQLPEEVGKLVHLHYLNVSNNGRLRVLPESLCSLLHLQTLRLSRCWRLRELPRGMGKLVNLRHLEVEGTNLRAFPKGMRKLSSLHTLTEFIVSWDNFDDCKLPDLKNFNSLEGSLAITGLGDVLDAREAEKAALKNKEHLRHLKLSFWGEKRDLREMKGVAEALEPHQNLKSLGIYDYIDTEFPNWMASLTQLTRLQLSRCIDCLHLPPLGRLPVLESLEVSRMDSLKSIDLEFLGMDQPQAFPKLKQLIFSELGKWEKWQIQDHEQHMSSIMPCLDLLIINGCPKLEELPDQLFQRAPLQELQIYASPILRRGYQMGGDHWSTISHIPITEICENDKQMLVDYHSYYFQYRNYWERCQNTAKLRREQPHSGPVTESSLMLLE